MTAHQAVHPVAALCRTLGVSPSGYYAWRKRPLSPRARADVELTAQIEAVHRDSRGTYGAPRIHAELAAQSIHIGRKRIARLMRTAGLQGVSRRQCRTTVRDEAARPAPDLVDRQFTAAGPDRLWVAFGRRCREAGVRPSMGSVGDAYDNAMCESFFATLECEVLDRHRFRTQADARLAVFDFIEGWYNPRRRHSALDYLSPMIFERAHGIGDRTVASRSTIDHGGAISVSPLEVVQR